MINMVYKILFNILTALAVMLTLVGCDPSYSYSVYVKNTTSQTITFCAIPKGGSDSLESYYFNQKINHLTLNEGEKGLLIRDGGLGTISSDDLSWIIEGAYPYGIVIKFENGDSLVYYPSGADKDFHSPYNKNSFFSVDKTEYEMVSEYYVLY